MERLRELMGIRRRERPAVRRIRQLARHVGARSYLEIGVNAGLTFNALEFDRKVAVDPNFRFDISRCQRAGAEFHPMTSDRYFLTHGAAQKFDLIFLDGLHVFQQTFRDFCNSLVCSHERTLWLIDDVIPCDVYSAWPNQGEAVAFRKDAGGDSPLWHGDVYKVVFAIHDFFPMLSYITIGTAENAQAVVWRAPRPDFVPVFESLGAIERLGYFDFLKNRAVMNFQTEEDGLQAIFSAIPEALGDASD